MRRSFLRDPKRKSALEKIVGWLLIPIWIAVSLTSTLFLAALAIVVSIRSLTLKKSEPKFKPRPIFVRD